MAKAAETKPKEGGAKEGKEKTAEVKKTKKALSDDGDQLQFYKSIVDNFSDAICVADMKLNIIATNPAIEHLSGYKVDELVGLSVTNMPIIGKDDIKKIMKDLHESVYRRKIRTRLAMCPSCREEFLLPSKAAWRRT